MRSLDGDSGGGAGVTYTPEMVRGYLCNYQRRAMDTRPRPPDDKLAVRVPPLEEAPYAASSCVWSDIEIAMRNLPYNWEKITFAVLCLGGGKEGTSWRKGMSVYNWREKVGGLLGTDGWGSEQDRESRRPGND